MLMDSWNEHHLKDNQQTSSLFTASRLVHGKVPPGFTIDTVMMLEHVVAPVR